MKKLVLSAAVTAFVLALPLAAAAQDAKPKAAASTAAKPAVKHKAPISRRAAKAVEEVTPITEEADVTLGEAEMAIAKRVLVGKMQCELGADITVAPDEKKVGTFTVANKGRTFKMHPVESRTGAIRLEAPKAGVVLLQLANKSMLLNQEKGERLADECQAPEQVAAAEEMKKNPPKALFDGADATSTEAKPPEPAPAPVKKAAAAPKKKPATTTKQ